MALRLFPASMDFTFSSTDKRLCTVCKSEARRVFWPESGQETTFGMLTYSTPKDMKKDEPPGFGLVNNVWPMKMYACTNMTCLHVDLYHIGLTIKH